MKDELVDNCERYLKQAMTGHTCGGPHPLCFSSDCVGCCPDTQQHYRSAAEMIIAWTVQTAIRACVEHDRIHGILAKNAYVEILKGMR